MAEIDMVNHPPHYTQGKYETIDIIEDTTWGYRLATAFKYLHRCEYKGKKREDLRKAVWFILREIDNIPDDVVMYSEDTEYDMVCLVCKHFKSVLNKDLTCIDCLYPQGGNIDPDPHVEEATKTAIGDSDNPHMGHIVSKGSVSHSNGLSPSGKVIPHNLPKDVLGAHTERQNAELDRREEYRVNYRRSFGTHKPNSDQLVMKELSQYD